jgi:DNA-binding transcriptional regulator YiaG
MTPAEITSLRNRLGLTHEAFSRLVGCSLNTVFRWERGTGSPTGLYAARLREIALEAEAKK